MLHSPKEILDRINKVLLMIFYCMEEERPLALSSPFEPISNTSATGKHTFRPKTLSNIKQARSITGIVLVLSYIQNLMLHERTATNRELYYFFVTFFRNQKECDGTIGEICNLLQVERISLGLNASPKGWFSGDIKIVRNGLVKDGRNASTVQGFAITREWIYRATSLAQQLNQTVEESIDHGSHDSDSVDESLPFSKEESKAYIHPESNFEIHSNAKAIVIIEKEGIYNRLAEDLQHLPIILITGKGNPDHATRAMVYCLWKILLGPDGESLPIYGIADCNPYGIGVLQTYANGFGQSNDFQLPVQWLGLRPCQLLDTESSGENEESELWNKINELPNEVYQKLTEMDERKLKSLLQETNGFVQNCPAMKAEIHLMKENNWKLELESLNWLGMNFLSDFVSEIILYNLNSHSFDVAEDETNFSSLDRKRLAC